MENGLRTVTITRMYTLPNVKSQWDVKKFQSVGFTSDALPEVQKPSLAENSQTRGITMYALSCITPKVRQWGRIFSICVHLEYIYGFEKDICNYWVRNSFGLLYQTRKLLLWIKNMQNRLCDYELTEFAFSRECDERIDILFLRPHYK